jgi:hypothetical protein
MYLSRRWFQPLLLGILSISFVKVIECVLSHAGSVEGGAAG